MALMIDPEQARINRYLSKKVEDEWDRRDHLLTVVHKLQAAKNELELKLVDLSRSNRIMMTWLGATTMVVFFVIFICIITIQMNERTHKECHDAYYRRMHERI